VALFRRFLGIIDFDFELLSPSSSSPLAVSISGLPVSLSGYRPRSLLLVGLLPLFFSLFGFSGNRKTFRSSGFSFSAMSTRTWFDVAVPVSFFFLFCRYLPPLLLSLL